MKVYPWMKELGIERGDLSANWNPKDERQDGWKEERKKWGFDERDTWSLYSTIAVFVYPRLKMFKEYSCGYPCSETKESWNEKLDKMLDAFKIIIEEDRKEYGMSEEEREEGWRKVSEGLDLFAECFRGLWW